MTFNNNDSDEIVPIIRQAVLSALVVVSFAGYTIYERLVNPGDGATVQVSAATPEPTIPPPTRAPERATPIPSPTTTVLPARPGSSTPVPAARPSATATPTALPAAPAGGYHDGEYTGSVVNAYFGNLQVKAVIQGGKLADVQFVDYPHDRRTSLRINAVANPRLQTEAIQIQRAGVHIISGATLTSEAFIKSLQAALDKARA